VRRLTISRGFTMPGTIDVREAAAQAEREAIRAREMQRRGPPVVVAPADPPVVIGAMGWMRDVPDFRDYAHDHEKVKPLIEHLKLPQAPGALPADIDLRPYCTRIENQGALGSCTANAGVGMYEYFIKLRYGKEFDLSRLFLYKVTRNLLHWTGDTGGFLRTTMGALVLFGVPPEEYWPYVIGTFDAEPSAFCYSFAEDFQALTYFRLDAGAVPRDQLLARIKTFLAAGVPPMFGFTVYNSIAQAATTGEVPFPAPTDRVVGGHAVLAVGYSDTKKIKNTTSGAETNGALLIRNSWGTGWGAAGYGWLPYDYVLRSLAVDWWSMLKGEWVATGVFGQ
jgi:C1A family cysteine protease